MKASAVPHFEPALNPRTLLHMAESAATAQLAMMGFAEADARTALQCCGGDISRAVEWLAEHASEQLPAAAAQLGPISATPSRPHMSAAAKSGSEGNGVEERVITLVHGGWRRKRAVARAGGQHFVSPGELITREIDLLHGHGTFLRRDGALVATVAGVVQYIDRLVMVRPLKTR